MAKRRGDLQQGYNIKPRFLSINACVKFVIFGDQKPLVARTNQEPATKQLKRRTWQWLGHTLRKLVGTITRQTLEWNLKDIGEREDHFTAGEDRGTRSWRKLDIPGAKQKG